MGKKATGLLLSVLLMTACGGRPTDSTPNASFINNTQHSTAQLQALWNAAQQTLSQQIDLNPLQRELYNSAPNIVPGDARDDHMLEAENALREANETLEQRVDFASA